MVPSFQNDDDPTWFGETHLWKGMMKIVAVKDLNFIDDR